MVVGSPATKGQLLGGKPLFPAALVSVPPVVFRSPRCLLLLSSLLPRFLLRDYTTTGIKKLPQELNLIPVVVVIPKALPSGITTTIGIKL